MSRIESAKQAAAARSSLAKARAVARTKPRTGRQRAAATANLSHAWSKPRSAAQKAASSRNFAKARAAARMRPRSAAQKAASSRNFAKARMARHKASHAHVKRRVAGHRRHYGHHMLRKLGHHGHKVAGHVSRKYPFRVRPDKKQPTHRVRRRRVIFSRHGRGRRRVSRVVRMQKRKMTYFNREVKMRTIAGGRRRRRF